MPKPPAANPLRPASSAQINYLEILFNDLGFSRKARNGFLSRELGRMVSYLDELNSSEASRFIQALKERKEDRKLLEQVLEEEQEY